MTEKQLYSEIITMMAKHQVEQDQNINKDMKEAQKAMLDAAKELFVNNDKDTAIVYLSKTLTILSSM